MIRYVYIFKKILYDFLIQMLLDLSVLYLFLNFTNSFIKFVSGIFNKRGESINKSFNFYITKKHLVF